MINIVKQPSEGDTKSGLPEGWTLTKLGDLCSQPQYGWTTSADKNGTGLKLLRTTDISSGAVNWSTVPACTQDPDDPHKYLLGPGDILVSRAGSVGLSYLVQECPEAIFASYLIRFRPNPPLESEFVALYLKSPQYWAVIAGETAGIAIPNVNASKLKQIGIPLPPLAEQKRIVAKVEELVVRVNAAKEHLSKVSAILKRFRQALLSAACSGRLTADWRETYLHFERPEELIERIHRERLTYYEELCRTPKQTAQKCPRKPSNLKPQIRQSEIEIDLPASWFWTSLEDIASVRQYSMSSGPFGSALGNKDYRHSGVPVIRGQNIQNGVFLLRNYVYVSEKKASELVRSIAYPGDIVVVAVGSSGQAAIVPKDLPKAVLSQNCNKITIDGSIALPEFVILILQIEIAKNQLREKTTDTARPFLSLTNLKKTLVALPQVEEQKEIVRRVEEMFKLADAVDKQLKAATARADRLTQAILTKAFRGELVPTEAELARREGRSYETASELLARIKSDREGKIAESRHKSRGD
jgi:type I restriction enzyme S subunit